MFLRKNGWNASNQVDLGTNGDVDTNHVSRACLEGHGCALGCYSTWVCVIVVPVPWLQCVCERVGGLYGTRGARARCS
jgi:hypothetical protein